VRRSWMAGGALVVASTAAAQQRPAADPDTIMVCVPSIPATSPLDTVTVSVYPYDSTARYAWTPTGGRLVGAGASRGWVLRDAGLGVYQTVIIMTGRDGQERRCTVQVKVVPPSGTMGGLPARSFLQSNASERAGYGLYSYLLLGAKPDGAAQGRYRSAVAEFVRLLPAIGQYSADINPLAVNINYLPVSRIPTSDSADRVLEQYDYARAQVLLRVLPGPHFGGPYLVSVRTPLSSQTTAPKAYIAQDLSTVPDTLVGVWVREFLSQATQERLDSGFSLRGLALRLRTLIGVVALGLPDVVHSMAEWKTMWSGWVATEDAK
jgi:hypothetical protein